MIRCYLMKSLSRQHNIQFEQNQLRRENMEQSSKLLQGRWIAVARVGAVDVRLQQGGDIGISGGAAHQGLGRSHTATTIHTLHALSTLPQSIRTHNFVLPPYTHKLDLLYRHYYHALPYSTTVLCPLPTLNLLQSSLCPRNTKLNCVVSIFPLSWIDLSRRYHVCFTRALHCM